ncbi:hypothetical protein H920_10839 [Fukomys damarensis]|uniref:Uncharacterized protein n=1 Tax=Fukomys damarensis TaxID=885580 RepID=A0A091DBW9_FUKDA|nr:hypothetical protein H920_10839 [Fukomys damarensis]
MPLLTSQSYPAGHGTWSTAALVARLSYAERQGSGCSCNLLSLPCRAGAAPGQDRRNECWTLKNKVVGYPDDAKCLH